MPLIKKVKSIGDYHLFIELGNGHSITLNMENKLDTIRFIDINNKDIFNRVSTDGSSIFWSNGKIRINFAEIIEIMQFNQTRMVMAV